MRVGLPALPDSLLGQLEPPAHIALSDDGDLHGYDQVQRPILACIKVLLTGAVLRHLQRTVVIIYIEELTDGGIVETRPNFDERLDRAKDMPAIFELVKSAVRKSMGKERSGLILGLSNLGGDLSGFVGAFYPVATNIIVMNTLPLRRIRETKPELYKPYVFHILLHEYLHTLGIMDEGEVRTKALKISEATFGPGHPATDIARDLNKFMPHLVYPIYGWKPKEEPSLELVPGFDRSSTDSYIH